MTVSLPDLSPQHRRIVAEASRERRRATGRYYTPGPLADYVARRALEPLLEGAGAHDLAHLRILDPAMGDGAILKAAAALLDRRLSEAATRGCLHGVDTDARAVAEARRGLGPGASASRLLVGDMLAPRPPFHDRAGRFDVVIGNPPWGGWDRRLGPARKAAYRARFATAQGRLEPAALFIETATRLLKDGGRLALVLPDYLLLKNYPAARRHLLEHYDLEELVHWGRAFPDVNLDAFTLVARRRIAAVPRPAGGRVLCLPDGPGGRRLRIPQRRFREAPGHVFNLSLAGADAALLARIEARGAALGRWLEAHEGIHSGNIRGRLFVAPGAPLPPGARAEPLLFGRDEIAPFRLAPAGWRVLYDRTVIRRQSGEYASLGRPEWHRPPKLMIRRTGDRLIAALDREGLFASNNLFVARARPACPVPLEYLEAWLNSALATWCFRAIQPRAGRLFAELKLVHLARIPAPLPRSASGVRAVIALAARAARGEPGARDALNRRFAAIAGLTSAQEARVSRGAPRAGDFL